MPADPLLTRKYLLLAKVEGTYGVDSAPTAAANAILVKNLKIKPDQEIIDRKDVSLPDLSKLPHLVGRRWCQVDFDVELRGSGADGVTPPDFGVLLRACSMSETIDSDSVTYEPVSESQKSITIYAWKDAQLFKLVGCVGDWKMAGEVGKAAIFSFTFKGKLSAVLDQAMGTPTYQNLTPPLLLSAQASYGSWAPPLSKVELALKNKITERKDINDATGIIGFFVSDREPEGKLDPEAAALATRDVWANFWAVNEAALSLVIGETSANRCTITAPKCAKKNLDWGDRDGLATYDMGIGLYRVSGNDEISLMFD